MSQPPSGYFGNLDCSPAPAPTISDFPKIVFSTPQLAWAATQPEAEPYLLVPSSAFQLNYSQPGANAQMGYFEPLTNHVLATVDLQWGLDILGRGPGWWVNANRTCDSLLGDGQPELNITEQEGLSEVLEPLPTPSDP